MIGIMSFLRLTSPNQLADKNQTEIPSKTLLTYVPQNTFSRPQNGTETV